MKHPKISGIYGIRHISSGRVYIGSSNNIYNRWRGHKSDLRRGVHANVRLQRAWNKHGEAAFEFVVAETCLNDPVILCHREQVWIDRNRDNLYNASREALPNTGKVISPEHREILRARMLGNKNGAGRSYCGVLRSHDVARILHRYASGDRTIDIAADFKVSPTNIGRIANRTIWRDVEIPPDVEEARAERMRRPHANLATRQRKLDWETVQVILGMYVRGSSQADLSRQFGVSDIMISNIVRGRAWSSPPPEHDITSEPPTAPDAIKPMKLKRGFFERKPPKIPASRLPRTLVACNGCGKELSRISSAINPSGIHFCTLACRNAVRKAKRERHPGRPRKRAITGAAIFAFVHVPTGRHYVGQAGRFENTRNSHWKRLKSGLHGNRELQDAYSADGKSSITWKILETPEADADLASLQQEWIVRLGATSIDLRTRPRRKPTLKRPRSKMSEATKAKKAAAMLRRSRLTPEVRCQIRNRLEAGESINSVAKSAKCQRQTIRNIRDEPPAETRP